MLCFLMLVEDPRKSSGSVPTNKLLMLLSTKPEAVLVSIFQSQAKLLALHKIVIRSNQGTRKKPECVATEGIIF